VVEVLTGSQGGDSLRFGFLDVSIGDRAGIRNTRG
jgi:hypothetical protein